MQNLKNGIRENLTEVYTHSWGYKVLACMLIDKGTMQKRLGMFVEDDKGNLSNMIPLKNSRLKKKDALNFLLDYEGDFDLADCLNVRNCLQDKIKNLKQVEADEKIPFKQVYKELCIFGKDNEKEDIITIKDGYCSIDKAKFKQFVDKSQFGYSGLEVQKMLKVVGLLRINANRPYDYAMTDKDGNQYRTISFLYEEVEGI